MTTQVIGLPTVTTTVASQYELQSTRVFHGLAVYGLTHGITEADCDNFGRLCLAKIRQAVRDHSVKQIETDKGTKAAKEFATKQRVSGKETVAITFRRGEQWLLANSCPRGVVAIIRQDQSLASLESTGDGMPFTVIPDSHAGFWIATRLAEFKGSRPQTYSVEAQAEKATSEEVALMGE